jgi:hypothetical protein
MNRLARPALIQTLQTLPQDGMAAPLSVRWADTDLRARRNNQKTGQQGPAAAAATLEGAEDRTVGPSGSRPT